MQMLPNLAGVSCSVTAASLDLPSPGSQRGYELFLRISPNRRCCFYSKQLPARLGYLIVKPIPIIESRVLTLPKNNRLQHEVRKDIMKSSDSTVWDLIRLESDIAVSVLSDNKFQSDCLC